MADSTNSHIGRCESCERAYRVREADRTYPCKCGGEVRVPRSASDQRRAAAAELRRVYRWIDGVTWFHRIGALAYGGVTLLAILALGRNEVPLGAGVLVVALAASLTVMTAMGAVQILFKPFVWTLAVALVATVVSVAHRVGPNPLGLAFYWSAAWAAVFWASAWPAWRLRRLIAAHRDMYIMHHASQQTLRSLKGRSPEQKHERLVAAMRRAGRKAWRVSAAAAAVVLIASAGGTLGVVTRLRPEGFASAVSEFESAWDRADVGAIADRLLPAVRAQEIERLEGFGSGHGWGEGLPELGMRDVCELEDRIRVDYWVGDVLLSIFWAMDDRRWSVLQVDLPRTPFRPALDGFLEAWASSDRDAILSLFAPPYREKMSVAIESSLDLRGWEELPKVLDAEVADREDGIKVVSLVLIEGVVTTKWRFREADAQWGLQGIQFPKRT